MEKNMSCCGVICSECEYYPGHVNFLYLLLRNAYIVTDITNILTSVRIDMNSNI